MLIAIPLDKQEPKDGKIVARALSRVWAVVDFDEGEVKNITFKESFEKAFEEFGWIDFVVLENKFENYIDIMEYGSMVLVRRASQDTVELIIEAFKFKELDEIGL